MSAREYLDRAIAGFVGDPPATEYQRGFLDALKVARAEAFEPAAVSLIPVANAGAENVAPLRSGSERTQPHAGADYGSRCDEFPK